MQTKKGTQEHQDSVDKLLDELAIQPSHAELKPPRNIPKHGSRGSPRTGARARRPATFIMCIFNLGKNHDVLEHREHGERGRASFVGNGGPASQYDIARRRRREVL